MKITDVIAHQLQVNVDEPFTSSRGWYYKTKGALVVEVRTDEGITGWGDCYGPAAVCKAIVDTLLKPSVVGKDPFDVEVIWEALYNKVKDYGLSGMTISGHQRRRHRALGHHRQGVQEADSQADRRQLPAAGGGVRDRALLQEHGPPERGGGGGGARLRGAGLPLDQDEDRPRLAQEGSRSGGGGARCRRAGRPAHGGCQSLLQRAAGDQHRPRAREARRLLVRGTGLARGPRGLRRGVATPRHGGGGRRERVHQVRIPRHHRPARDGHRAAGRLRRRRHHRVQEDRHARAGGTASSASRTPGAPRSASPRRSISSRRCRSARPAWCRSRRSSSTSRPSIRSATS